MVVSDNAGDGASEGSEGWAVLDRFFDFGSERMAATLNQGTHRSEKSCISASTTTSGP